MKEKYRHREIKKYIKKIIKEERNSGYYNIDKEDIDIYESFLDKPVDEWDTGFLEGLSDYLEYNMEYNHCDIIIEELNSRTKII